MSAAVEVDHVTHIYVTEASAHTALERVGFAVQPGEFVSLIGPSGCGKTTLLSLVAGLLQPTAGTVSVAGEPVRGPSPRVGYMLQSDYLFPWRTIWDNAVIGLEVSGRRSPHSEAYVWHLLDEMGLARYARYYPSQLSGGMRQRVALVRTLATGPELLLLDEPFSALDYQTKLQLEELIAATLQATGKTALLVTHDIAEAAAMSDRILVLEPGPGRLRREFAVPRAVREAGPLAARELPDFHPLVRELWQEFEAMQRKGGDAHAG